MQAENLKVVYNRDSTIPQKIITIEPTAELTVNVNSGKIWCWTSSDNFEVFFVFLGDDETSFEDLCENPSRLGEISLVELLCEPSNQPLPWFMKKDNSNFRGKAYPEQPIDQSTLPSSISSSTCSSSDAYCPGDRVLQKLNDNSFANFDFIQSFLGVCQSSPLYVKKKVVKEPCSQIASNAAELTSLADIDICATKKCLSTVSLSIENAAGSTVDLNSPTGSYVKTLELRIVTSSTSTGYAVSYRSVNRDIQLLSFLDHRGHIGDRLHK